MERQEVVGIFHAKRVILRSSVYSLAIAREKGGNRDSQSRTQKCKLLNKTPSGLMLLFTAPIVSDQTWSVIDGGGGVNLYFYRLGTATSVLSMEYMDN